MKETVYYIVSVKCKNQQHCTNISSKEPVWLTLDDGYYSHTSYKKGAQKFNEPPSKKLINAYSGYPWYYEHVPNSEEVYRVTEWYDKREELL